MSYLAATIRFLFLGIDEISTRRKHTLAISLTGSAAIVFALIGYLYGPIITSDGFRDYELARLLIAAQFNISEFSAGAALLQSGFEMPQPFLSYLVYYFALAICHTIAGENWPSVVVLVNIIAFTSVFALCIGLAASIGRTVFATVLIAALFITSWDFVQWLAMTQSDAIFCLFATLVLVFAIRGLAGEETAPSGLFLAACLLFAVAAMFAKPTALPLLAFAIFTCIVGFSTTIARSRQKTDLAYFWFLGLILAWVGGLFLGVIFLANPEILPEGTLRSSFRLFAAHTGNGEIQWARPEAKLLPDHSRLGMARIVAARLAYYFWFIADDYSFSHKLINAVTVLPLYSLVLLAITRVFFLPKSLTDQERLIGILMIAFIGMFDVYHAITILDFDWRYRAPIYPAMFVLAVIGARPMVDWMKFRILGGLTSPSP